MQDLAQRVEKLERALADAAGTGLVMVLFACFCALWAQDVRRWAWLWLLLD